MLHQRQIQECVYHTQRNAVSASRGASNGLFMGLFCLVHHAHRIISLTEKAYGKTSIDQGTSKGAEGHARCSYDLQKGQGGAKLQSKVIAAWH